MIKSALLATALVAGFAASAQAQTIEITKPVQVAERVTIIRHDNGLHRGWYHRHHGWRHHAWRDHDHRRVVKKTITRHPDGSVTRTKTVRRSNDD